MKKKWITNITSISIKIPKSIAIKKESINSVCIQVYGDASAVANCAAVYAVVNQPSAVRQGLVARNPEDLQVRPSKHFNVVSTLFLG